MKKTKSCFGPFLDQKAFFIKNVVLAYLIQRKGANDGKKDDFQRRHSDGESKTMLSDT